MPFLFDYTRDQHAHSTLDHRTFLSDRLLGGRGKKWTSGIASLPNFVTKQSCAGFRVETRRGKGGHAMRLGDRVTTLPSREIAPKTARKIRKSLRLD
jgi:hypothetical protein